jgi:hypothetical protein
MNTRDKFLLDLTKERRYYAIPIIIRQMVIDECCEELAKYAFTSHAYSVLQKLKRSGLCLK